MLRSWTANAAEKDILSMGGPKEITSFPDYCRAKSSNKMNILGHINRWEREASAYVFVPGSGTFFVRFRGIDFVI